MAQKDLSVVLQYEDKHPIRVGKYHGEVIYSLSDLMQALKLPSGNVTHIMQRVPEETFFRATSVGMDGMSANTRVVAVTYEGAWLSLPRLKNVDLYDVLCLARWMKTVKADKMGA